MFNLFFQGKKINSKPFLTYKEAMYDQGLNLITYGYKADIHPESFYGEYRISFYEGSDHVKNMEMMVCENTLHFMIEIAKEELLKFRLYRKGNYWCSFSVKDKDGVYQEYDYLFKLRIKN